MKQLFIVVWVLFLTACANMKTQPIHVTMKDDVETTFVYSNPNLSDSVILNQFASSFIENSNHSKIIPDKRSDKVVVLKGVETFITDSSIVVSYLNGSKHLDTGKNYGTRINVPYDYSIADADGKKHVTLHSPKFFDVLPGRNILMIPFDPLISVDETIKDIKQIYENFRPTIHLSQLVMGEVNSIYNVDSVKTAVASSLGTRSTRDLMYNIFKVPFKKGSLPVEMSFAPYRNGTKVVYSFHYPYEEYRNGKSSFDIDEIKAIKKAIHEAVNS